MKSNKPNNISDFFLGDNMAKTLGKWSDTSKIRFSFPDCLFSQWGMRHQLIINNVKALNNHPNKQKIIDSNS